MPHKENRKIIKIGQGSLGVTLPKSWLRYFSLDEKDTIKMISNGEVKIRPIGKNLTNSRRG